MKRRVAVLGLGSIARKAYLPVLAERPDLDLVLFSRRQETVDAVRSLYRLENATTSFDTLLSLSPQAAFVLSPSETHFGLARRLLESGIDCFLEKPATMTSRETLSLAELARSRGRVLMVGFNRRFAPLNERARGLWGPRRVGMAVFEKHRETAVHNDLLSNFTDDTIHLVDLARFFCGEVRALSTAFEAREGRLVGASSVLALEGGGQAIVVTSLEAGCWLERYSLHGEAASVHVEAFASLRFNTSGEERLWREPYASDWRPTLVARGFPQQVGHFLDCVLSRQEPRSSGFEAYKTQRVVEQLVECGRCLEGTDARS